MVLAFSLVASLVLVIDHPPYSLLLPRPPLSGTVFAVKTPGMRRRKVISLVLLSGSLVLAPPARAGTELNFWHSYVHQPDGVTHFSFHIANYKRGLFFGSCGPSTRSLQWSYDVDLAGAGPLYNRDQIKLSVDGKQLEVSLGTISIDSNQQHATIQLQITQPSTHQPATSTNFAGNGTHQIRMLK